MINFNKFTKFDRILTVILAFWILISFYLAAVGSGNIDIEFFIIFTFSSFIGALILFILAVGVKWISAADKEK